MRISEVMEITALTKKAINYYEEEGLIKPATNEENNYREYSKEDIDKLIQISVLRKFDVSIKEIKDILQNPELLKENLECHLLKLGEEAKRIDKNRKVIKTCLSNLSSSKIEVSDITKELSILNKCLDMDDKSREGYMRRQIERIFPGNFGKMMAINYSPFLNEPLDTKEKEEAWIDLVKYLDETESLEYPVEMKKLYDGISEEEIRKYEKITNDNVERWLNITEEQLREEKEKILEFYRRFKIDLEVQEGWKKTFEMNKTIKKQMEDINYHEKFASKLRVLSKDYSKYIENKAKLNGILNIKVDEDGMIIINE
ncbi:MerR family transcriptional regulator [Clostridium sp. YIM B02551]|uniref:MerR family transcriptional regulator n=1 Tax=Clostridium sp. YIM B02551 TaxID=2910679 RepID=UPI001EEB96D2|nr:MerR family transcriptional regulator [Clostridium sp. YIM B02551]